MEVENDHSDDDDDFHIRYCAQAATEDHKTTTTMLVKAKVKSNVWKLPGRDVCAHGHGSPLDFDRGFGFYFPQDYDF